MSQPGASRIVPFRFAAGGLLRPVGVLAVLATAVTACSSSGGDSPSKSSSTSEGATSATSSSSAPATSASGSGAPADAATKAAVTKAYQTFFNSNSTLDQSVAALQNGAKLRSAVSKESDNPEAKGASVTVSAVDLTGPAVATVTFTILSNGQPLLPNTHGNAVKQGGTWKVAAQTFCALLTLEGKPPAACNDPAVTSLPS